ncbi:YciI family protein [Halopseudomonas sp.]|jgi:PhnB protein|uniref:YciI family protein n=1 Tax=Halopseudomonas sp. TaxID=2901191 RepID=UPI0039E52970
MKYMLMRKADDRTERGEMPSNEMLATMASYNQQMFDAGVFVDGNGLSPSSEGCRITFRDGVPTVTDGPFTETRELLAGYSILDVDSREEAIAWACKWPRMDNEGNVTLELRRYFDLEDFVPGTGLDQHRQMAASMARRPSSVSMHLVFNGNCREAMNWYAEVLGARVLAMLTHAETPAASEVPPECQELIIHSEIQIGRYIIMAADMMGDCYQSPRGHCVQLQYDKAQDARVVFDQLATGGSVQMPFDKTFWAEGFGMLTDRFGSAWMLNAGVAPIENCAQTTTASA